MRGTASLDPQTAHEIHELILNSDLTVIEIDHHIPDDLKNRFTKNYNHRFKIADGFFTTSLRLILQLCDLGELCRRLLYQNLDNMIQANHQHSVQPHIIL